MRIRRRIPLLLLQASSVIPTARANTEKTIFLAPPPITLPNVHPGLGDLCIDSLSPEKSTVQTQLPVSFPNKTLPRGRESWYLLDRLRAGQHYEVRVCWVATEPTEFWLDTFPISHVFETPKLISGLAEYSGSRPEGACPKESPINPSLSGTQTSVLFLRLHAAADYFTSNKTLMREPPLVGVDIILDPFLFNILPRSLLPTVAYIVLIAVGGWLLSGMLWSWLRSIGQGAEGKSHGD